MPETSLKAYFSKLNSLLSANAADEVIHHCRHILHYFPKNVIAYRLMGRALVANGRWDEGREVLRRVLGVIPDDYAAHLGLSEANERLNHPDEAIWHLERAFEQRPNDKELIDALRGLYRRHRNIDNLKIQLTSAAVARQYMRSGSYTQAIDTLRNALKRMTDRIDLKLLLAQILWQQGSEEEAAEIALEVLKVLPDCLEANRIMAALWLSVDRPSDARRYVNRLESVEPYSAIELVQGYAPDDDAFRIEELDYERSAKSELTSARPDWLQEISSTANGDAGAQGSDADHPQDDEWSNWASAMLNNQSSGASAQAVEAPKRSAETPVEPKAARPESSIRYTPPTPEPSNEDAPITTSGLTDLFGSPDTVEADDLASLFGDDSDDEGDPMAWLRDSGVEIVEEDEVPDYDTLFGVDEPLELGEEDPNPLAWMGNSDDLLIEDDLKTEVEDDKGPGPKTTYWSDEEEDEDEDPFAWMREADANADEEDEIDDAQPSVSLYEDSTEDGLEFVYSDSLYTAIEDEASQPSSEVELTSEPESDEWEMPSFDDVMGDEPQASAPEAPSNDQPVKSGDESVPGPRRGLTAILQDANLDWMQQASASQDEIVSDDEMDDWLNQFGGASGTNAKVDDTPDWLTEIGEPDFDSAIEEEADEDDWLAEVETDSETPIGTFEPMTTRSAADWLSSEQRLDEDDEDSGDWLAEFAPEAEEPSGEFTWMSDEVLAAPETDDEALLSDEALDAFTEQLRASMSEDDVDDDAAEPAESDDLNFASMDVETSDEEDVPDWMSRLDPEANKPEEVTNTMNSDNEFNWLNDPESNADDQGDLGGDMPDWLNELEPEAATQQTPEMSASDVEDDDDDWLSELGGDAEAVAGDIPDWMNELAPAATDSETQDAVAEMQWSGALSENPEEQAADEDEALVGEVPDWLNDLRPDEDSETGDALDVEIEQEVSELEEEYSWLNETDAGSGAESETESETEVVAGDIPDWMSELAPEQSGEVEAAPVEEDAVAELDWTGDLAQADEEAVEAAIADDVPDWLSELEPTDAEAITEPQVAPEEEESLEWTGELETVGEEAEAAIADDVPDWLSELEPTDAEAITEPQVAPEEEEALEWEGELETVDEEEAAAVADAVPDWLSELEPDESESLDEDAVAAESEADESGWLSEDAPEDEPVAETAAALEWEGELETVDEEEAAAVADDVPDWLSELEPTEVESPEVEPVAAADDDSDWLSEIAPDEEAIAEPAAELEWEGELETVDEEEAAAVADDVPDWLSELEPTELEAQPEPEPESETALEESYGWLNEPAAEAEEEAEAVAEEVPDWLDNDEAQPVEESASDDDFAWLNDGVAETELSDEDFAEETEAEIAAAAALVDADDEVADNQGEVDGDEEIEQEPAHNAPDWLNAMVPGLDVEYDVADDGVEDDAEATGETLEEEASWLVDLVEEETAAVEPAAFSFSRLPAWANARPPAAPAAADDDDFPDWPTDDADDDTPEWLR